MSEHAQKRIWPVTAQRRDQVLAAIAAGLATVLATVAFGGIGLVFIAKNAVWFLLTRLLWAPLLWSTELTGFLATRLIISPAIAILNLLGFGWSRIVIAPLFSRITNDEILDHDARDMLHGLIQNNPGIGLMELTEHTSLGWGTVVYHTGRLQQAALITSFKNGQNRHFFKNGHPAAKNKKAIAILRNENACGVARVVWGSAGLTQRDIAERLGIKPPTVTKYVQRLEAEGLVATAVDGRTKRVRPTDTLGPLLAHLEDIEVVNTHAALLVEAHAQETTRTARTTADPTTKRSQGVKAGLVGTDHNDTGSEAEAVTA